MVSGKLVRAEELVTGKSIPDVRTSGPLTESDIPADAFKKMKGANNPPWNKLPSGAQRMRSWVLSRAASSRQRESARG